MAAPPFQNPRADTIFRSSDNVEFRLHSVILAEASPLFQDMFSLPQSADTTGVIDMAESAHTLDRLFRLCYPVQVPLMDTIEDVRAVLEAALKYQMDIPVERMKKALVKLVHREPLRVYAIACHHGFENEAKIAAGKLAHTPASSTTYVSELEDISAGAYQRLLVYLESKPKTGSSIEFGETSSSIGAQDVSLLNKTTFTVPTTIGESTSTPPETILRGFSPSVVAAQSPFDSVYGDAILISHDNVEFRIVKKILSLSSPIFASLWDRPSPIEYEEIREIDGEGSLQHFLVPLDSHILDPLLRFCYPVDEPALQSAETTGAVLQAAIKFKMESVTRALKQKWRNLSAKEPMELYFLACRYGLEQQAREAAFLTLGRPGQDYNAVDMEASTGGALYRILEYKRQCVKTVMSVLSEPQKCTAVAKVIQEMNQDHDMFGLFQVHDCLRNVPPAWFRDVYEYHSKDCIRNQPGNRDALNSMLVQMMWDGSKNCQRCSSVSSKWIEICRILCDEVQRVISEVQLQFR